MKEVIKRGGARLSRSPKFRFGLVGVINTVVDMVVLSLLVRGLGVPLFFANIGSTTAALLTSFFLNKKAVFQGADGSNRRQFSVFLIVTLIGIWLVQGSILAAAYGVLRVMAVPEMMAVIVAKLCGICVGLVWNYLWYSRVVFKRVQP